MIQQQVNNRLNSISIMALELRGSVNLEYHSGDITVLDKLLTDNSVLEALIKMDDAMEEFSDHVEELLKEVSDG